jgi:lipoate-protein ligase B
MFLHLLQLGRVPYAEALDIQARVIAARKAGRIGDTLLLLEHPPVITLGRNSSRANVVASDEFLAARGVELHEINRGGDVTYHGPGQLVGYPIFDLRGEWPGKRGPGYRFLGPVDFVRMMEEALIRTCADFGVLAKRIPGCTGVWTFGGQPQPAELAGDPGGSPDSTSTTGESALPQNCRPAGESALPQNCHPERSAAGAQSKDLRFSSGTSPAARKPGAPHLEKMWDFPTSASNSIPEKKLAAIGIHVSQGVTSHGFALNVTTDLRDFEWIVPCGIRDRGVTSLELEAPALEADPATRPTMERAANSAARNFGRVFERQILACDSLDELLSQPQS